MPLERDVRLFVHGDEFMVEMPTHEDKRFENVLFPKYNEKHMQKFHLGGNASMETSLLNRVVRCDPASGKAQEEADTRHVCNGASRFWIGEVISGCDSCGHASKVGRTSTADWRENTSTKDFEELKRIWTLLEEK